MLDGKMEDDASLKQCLVMVELAEQLAAIDPELKAQYDAIEVATRTRMSQQFRPRRSVLYMPRSNERALEKAKTIACDALILDLEDAVAPDAKPAARDAACAAASSGEYGRRDADDPGQRHRHRVARRRHDGRRRGRPGRRRRAQGQQRRRGAAAGRRPGGGRRARPHHAVGDGRDARSRCCDALAIARRLRPAHGVRHGHQRPGQGAVRRARARPRSRSSRRCTSRCWPPGPPASRSSTASTTT